jgi:hypothetical protein
MGKFLLGAVIGALAFFVYDRQFAGGGGARTATAEYAEAASQELPERADAPAAAPAANQYQCDGRTYCSQMTSCEEATFFLRNCPGVQMDGEGDGIPCERQWCGTHR